MDDLNNCKKHTIKAVDANRRPGYRRLILQPLALIFILLLIPVLIRGAFAQEQKTSGGAGEDADEDMAELALPIPKPWTGDFDGMKEKRLIRILVPYSKTFFSWTGVVSGGLLMSWERPLRVGSTRSTRRRP